MKAFPESHLYLEMRLLALVLTCCIQSLYAQDMREHWILGDSMHLRFTDSGLVYLGHIPFFSQESLASISDETGSLQLFANEWQVFDANFNIIPEGDSLNSPPFFGASSTQGAVIVPLTNKYVFVNRIDLGFPNGALSYSIVLFDSLLESYYISPTLRRIIVEPQLFSEQLQLVKHGNGRDWWVIGRKLINVTLTRGNAFVVYLLSDSGMELVHEINIGLEAHVGGELTSNPDGSQLALASFALGRLQLFDFDRCSGDITNPRIIVDDSSSTYYGCAFSADGSKLYVAKNNREVLEQVDLSVEPYAITTIFSANFGPQNSAGQLELGPDGKIYWSQIVQAILFDSLPAMHLGVINSPNEPGLSCNFDLEGVYLGGRLNESVGLPNHPNYYLGPLVGSACDSLSDPDTSTAVQPTRVVSAEECFKLVVDASRHCIHVEPVRQIQNATLEVYNNTGFLQKVNSIQNTTVTWSTEAWPAGLYIAAIRTKEGTCASQKFVLSP